jgi:NAD-dependent dihydropyrimidine dehydrogenase PreA subunit
LQIEAFTEQRTFLMNKYKTVKTVRQICGLITLIMFLGIFLVPENILIKIAYLQFISVGIRSTVMFNSAAVGCFILLIAVTFIFGRIYCSFICPNGALVPLTAERKKSLQIGLVKYFPNRCLVVTDRTHCGICAENCPTGAIYMKKWGNGLTIPDVKADICIGCGACEYICPAAPDKALIVSGFKTQKTV